VWLWPVLDRAVAVDLREQVLGVLHQTTITKDNAPISIDFLVYSRIVNPVESVVQVADFARASQGLATTTLRAVIGDIQLDDVLSRREQINQLLQTKLDEVTARWGVKVTSVEIREIQPPREVQEAMNRQMSAERNRRAKVTEAEGTRQARITVAEGEKQAAILRAEGDRQAALFRAEGFSLGLRAIAQVARDLDPRTLQLQYFESLKALGAGAATKLVVPMELMSGLARLADGRGSGG
jgi:regulator of protease activity HflC (stomatin/prohibitin superfamily)